MAQGQNRSEHTHGLLFLTDEQLRKGIEAMFFAYRGFTADPDRILAKNPMAERITGRCISFSAALAQPSITYCPRSA